MSFDEEQKSLVGQVPTSGASEGRTSLGVGVAVAERPLRGGEGVAVGNSARGQIRQDCERIGPVLFSPTVSLKPTASGVAGPAPKAAPKPR